MLTATEHINEATDCLGISQRLVSRGYRRQASDILWLAVKHAISAIGIAHDESYVKFQHKRAIVRSLAAQHNDQRLHNELRVALKIHADADQGFLSAAQLNEWQHRTRLFIGQLITIYNAGSDGQRQPN